MKKNNLFKLFQKCTAILSSIFLIEINFSPLAIAQQRAPVNPIAATLTDVLKLAGGLGKQYANINEQAIREKMALAAQNQNMYGAPDSLFPQCRLNLAIQGKQHQGGACQPPSSSPGSMDFQSEMMQLNREYINSTFKYEAYRNLLTTGKKIGTNQGLQCIDESKDRLINSLDEFNNTLEAMKKQHDALMVNIKREHDKALRDLEDTNSLLTGRKKSSLKGRAQNIKKLFGPESACFDVLKQNLFGTGQGLYGIEDELINKDDGLSQKALNYNKTAKSLLGDFESFMDRINSEGSGLSPFSSKEIMSIGNTDNFGFEAVHKELQKSFELKVRKLTPELIRLKTLGVNIPSSIDENSLSELDEIASKGKSFFVEKAVQNCMKDNRHGVSFSRIVDEIEQIRFRNSNFKEFQLKEITVEVERILYSDDTTSQKINQIKAIERKYSAQGRLDIPLSKSYGSAGSKPTISEFLTEVQNQCQELSYITQDKNNASSLSARTIIERGVKALRDYQSLTRDFSNQLVSKMRGRVQYCKGVKQGISPGVCEKSFSPSSANFCFPLASKCSQKINSCVNKTNEIIADVQKRVEKQRIAYNAYAQRLLAQQQIKINAITGKVSQLASGLQKKFFASFNIPTDKLVITEPQTSNKTLGIDLIGGGDFSSLDQLPKIIDGYKTLVTDQKKEIVKKINKRRDDLKTAYQDEKKDWEERMEQCLTSFNEGNKMLDAANEKAVANYKQKLKERRDQMNLARRICRSLKAGVGPACDNTIEELEDDIQDITSAMEKQASEDAKSAGGTRSVANYSTAIGLGPEWGDAVANLKQQCANIQQTDNPDVEVAGSYSLSRVCSESSTMKHDILVSPSERDILAKKLDKEPEDILSFIKRDEGSEEIFKDSASNKYIRLLENLRAVGQNKYCKMSKTKVSSGGDSETSEVYLPANLKDFQAVMKEKAKLMAILEREDISDANDHGEQPDYAMLCDRINENNTNKVGFGNNPVGIPDDFDISFEI